MGGMKKKIEIKEKIVYEVGGESVPAAPRIPCVTYKSGSLGGPKVHDEELETRDSRKMLQGKEGKICLGVYAGEQLGELYISVQFEGPVDTGKGEPDLCIDGQNSLLEAASEWIAEVLGTLDADFDGIIEAQPCPKATKQLAIVKVVRMLESAVQKKTEVESMAFRSATRNREVK